MQSWVSILNPNRPFKVGEVSTGPHLIQLATLDKAYLFQMNDSIWDFLKPIFASREQIKVGFWPEK